MDGKYLHIIDKASSKKVQITADGTNATPGSVTLIDDPKDGTAKQYTAIAVSANGAYTYAATATDLYVKQFNDGTTVQVETGEAFVLSKDMSLNERIFINGDINARSELKVTGDVSLNSDLYVAGDVSLNNDMFVGNNVGIGIHNPIVSLDVSSNNAIRIPRGTTTERPTTTGESTEGGYIRYNMTTHQFEGYGPGSSWGSLGGVINVAQNTKIIASKHDADSTNNELVFFTAAAGSTVTGDAVERMVIKSTGDISMNHGLIVAVRSMNSGLTVTGATTITGALDANSTADIADTLTLSKATGDGLVVLNDSSLNGATKVTEQ